MKHGGVSALLFHASALGFRRHCGHDIETGYSPSFRDGQFESVVFEYDWHKTEESRMSRWLLIKWLSSGPTQDERLRHRLLRSSRLRLESDYYMWASQYPFSRRNC